LDFSASFFFFFLAGFTSAWGGGCLGGEALTGDVECSVLAGADAEDGGISHF
jgi:hypothetical protein